MSLESKIIYIHNINNYDLYNINEIFNYNGFTIDITYYKSETIITIFYNKNNKTAHSIIDSIISEKHIIIYNNDKKNKLTISRYLSEEERIEYNHNISIKNILKSEDIIAV
jgi:hypothetical protein